MSETLYLIDLYSLIFQVFHAIRDEMTSPSGRPTNAVYGFTRDLITILRENRPTYLIAAMDAPGRPTRLDLFSEYKANRSSMPDDLQIQIPMIMDVLEGFGIPVIEYPGWEADDVIATIVRQAESRDLDISIITSDKDARQLLGPRVRMYNMRKKTFLGPDELLADWGVEPHQVVDFQALVGDSVDNVPGVPLVGPKKASALLQQFGTLEEVLANADQAPGAKLRENLKVYADQARISRQLCELCTTLPIEVDWERARAGQYLDVARLVELCREYGFRSFPQEIAKLQAEDAEVIAAGETPAAKTPARPQQLFAECLTRDWHIVDTSEKFAAFVTELTAQRRFCLDLETTSVDAVRADIVGWAFSWQSGCGYYLPVRGPAGQPTLDPAMVVETLRPHLERSDIEIVNQNIKYDLLVLRRAGIHPRSIGIDPMVGSYLLDAGLRSHGLDELAKRYLNHSMIPITELIGTGKNQLLMSEVDIAKVAEYAVEDADISWQLAERIEAELKREGLYDLYWDLERPLIEVLVEMEHAGIRVDPELLRAQSGEAAIQLREIEQKIYAEAGHEFNIASPLNLREVLFQELKLPVLKRTKTGPSTDQEVLERLAPLHPLPALILEHRRLAKLKSTYLDALPTMVNPETGRIHASFNQVVAATGRLSSSDPNLQNIPIRTEAGRRVRQAFQPGEPGWKLLCADYSQIELRMLAHFSGDEALRDAFTQGADIHTAVAMEIFGVPEENVDREMRRVAKAVNFGVIYGQSSYGLATVLGIGQDVAGRFIDDYFQRYAGVDRYLQRVLDECRATGYATTIRGRRRPISGIRALSGRRQMNLPERTAINTVIQGSAADLIKQAMINIHRRLEREQHPARMLLQIHDELVFEVPEEHVEDLAALVRQEMEQALELEVPLQVDVSVGSDWLNVESLDEE